MQSSITADSVLIERRKAEIILELLTEKIENNKFKDELEHEAVMNLWHSCIQDCKNTESVLKYMKIPVDFSIVEKYEIIEAKAKTSEPVQAGAKIVEPVQAGAKIAEPVQAGAKIVEPVQAGAKIVEPVQAGAKIVEPVQTGAKIVEPVQAGAKIAEPVQAGAKTSKSQQSWASRCSSDAGSETGSISNSEDGASYTAKAKSGVNAVQTWITKNTQQKITKINSKNIITSFNLIMNARKNNILDVLREISANFKHNILGGTSLVVETGEENIFAIVVKSQVNGEIKFDANTPHTWESRINDEELKRFDRAYERISKNSNFQHSGEFTWDPEYKMSKSMHMVEYRPNEAKKYRVYKHIIRETPETAERKYTQITLKEFFTDNINNSYSALQD
jgi:hypothetical protein